MPPRNALQALIMLAVVLIGSVFFGSLFRRIKQPRRRSNLFGIVIGYNSGPHSHSHKSVLLSATSKSLIDAVVPKRASCY